MPTRRAIAERNSIDIFALQPRRTGSQFPEAPTPGAAKAPRSCYTLFESSRLKVFESASSGVTSRSSRTAQIGSQRWRPTLALPLTRDLGASAGGVRRRLETIEQRWLVVFDHAPDWSAIEALVPQGGARRAPPRHGHRRQELDCDAAGFRRHRSGSASFGGVRHRVTLVHADTRLAGDPRTQQQLRVEAHRCRS